MLEPQNHQHCCDARLAVWPGALTDYELIEEESALRLDLGQLLARSRPAHRRRKTQGSG
jgi:hypothetical protein